MVYALVTLAFVLAGVYIVYFFRRPGDWLPVLVIVYSITLVLINYFSKDSSTHIYPGLFADGILVFAALVLAATLIAMLFILLGFLRDFVFDQASVDVPAMDFEDVENFDADIKKAKLTEFQQHLESDADSTFYVGWPPRETPDNVWQRVKKFDGSLLHLSNNHKIEPHLCHSFIVVSAEGDVVLHYQVFSPVPEAIDLSQINDWLVWFGG